MFLCGECHVKSGCTQCYAPASNGACENCKKSAPCFDCHGYNFSGATEAEIEKMIRDVERGQRYSYWLSGIDGLWRQVTVQEYVNAERASGFHNTTGDQGRPATAGFGSSGGVRGAQISDTYEDSEEKAHPGSFERRYGWKGKQFVQAWLDRDQAKVETR